ncbi:MAG: hypothetical protein SNJ70_00215 [Armatimonadota bacterium]
MRKKPEGWAVDVPEDERGADISFRQRLADSNKIWIVAFLSVLVISILFIYSANIETSDRAVDIHAPKIPPDEFGDKSAYDNFANEFKSDKNYKDVILEAGFITPGKFRFVVKAESNPDEIRTLSFMAANKILRRFNHRVVVSAYMRSAVSSKESLMATTLWEPSDKGFVTRVESTTVPK